MSAKGPDFTHRDIEEVLGVYALNAVGPETAALVEHHLDGCIKCSVEVAQHREVAGLLANSGGAPPAGLWNHIARQLDGSTPLSWERLARRLELDPDGSDPIDDTFAEKGYGAVGSRNSAAGPSVIPITSRRPPRRLVMRAVTIVAAGAAVVAIVLGVQVDHLNHQVNALKAPTLLAQAKQAALSGPSTKLVQLNVLHNSPGSTPEGPVTVVLTKSGIGFVEAEGLSSLPKNETYQLWGVIGTQIISLGLLGSNPAVLSFSVAGNVPVSAFAITAEHVGGVVRSIHQPVVAGEVTFT